MCFEPRDYLRNILAEADYLIDQCAGLTAERFIADETLRRAFVRSLEIVEEATKKIFGVFAHNTRPLNGGLWLECVTASSMITLALITSLYGMWRRTEYHS